MGEYYLKCEPTNTKENMKDVLKFVNNPIFNNSIFSEDTLNSYFIILMFVIFVIAVVIAKDSKNKTIPIFISIISFVLGVIGFFGILK